MLVLSATTKVLPAAFALDEGFEGILWIRRQRRPRFFLQIRLNERDLPATKFVGIQAGDPRPLSLELRTVGRNGDVETLSEGRSRKAGAGDHGLARGESRRIAIL